MKKLKRKQLLIGATVLLVVMVVVGYFVNQVRNSGITQEPTAITNDNGINYGSPTEEEKVQAEKHKEDLVKQIEQESQAPSSQKKQVTPVITNASHSGQEVTVNAYIEGVFENNGTCTATFTKGSSKVTKTSEAFENVSTTNCAPFAIQRSEFANSGNWQLVVSYSSSTSEGSSQPRTVTLN